MKITRTDTEFKIWKETHWTDTRYNSPITETDGGKNENQY